MSSEHRKTIFIHELKTWPMYFEHILLGKKNFEIRKEDDRIFQVGDLVSLKEFDRGERRYTGRETIRKITYVLRSFDGLMPDYVVLGLTE